MSADQFDLWKRREAEKHKRARSDLRRIGGKVNGMTPAQFRIRPFVKGRRRD